MDDQSIFENAQFTLAVRWESAIQEITNRVTKTDNQVNQIWSICPEWLRDVYVDNTTLELFTPGLTNPKQSQHLGYTPTKQSVYLSFIPSQSLNSVCSVDDGFLIQTKNRLFVLDSKMQFSQEIFIPGPALLKVFSPCCLTSLRDAVNMLVLSYLPFSCNYQKSFLIYLMFQNGRIYERKLIKTSQNPLMFELDPNHMNLVTKRSDTGFAHQLYFYYLDNKSNRVYRYGNRQRVRSQEINRLGTTVESKLYADDKYVYLWTSGICVYIFKSYNLDFVKKIEFEEHFNSAVCEYIYNGIFFGGLSESRFSPYVTRCYNMFPTDSEDPNKKGIQIMPDIFPVRDIQELLLTHSGFVFWDKNCNTIELIKFKISLRVAEEIPVIKFPCDILSESYQRLDSIIESYFLGHEKRIQYLVDLDQPLVPWNIADQMSGLITLGIVGNSDSVGIRIKTKFFDYDLLALTARGYVVRDKSSFDLIVFDNDDKLINKLSVSDEYTSVVSSKIFQDILVVCTESEISFYDPELKHLMFQKSFEAPLRLSYDYCVNFTDRVPKCFCYSFVNREMVLVSERLEKAINIFETFNLYHRGIVCGMECNQSCVVLLIKNIPANDMILIVDLDLQLIGTHSLVDGPLSYFLNIGLTERGTLYIFDTGPLSKRAVYKISKDKKSITKQESRIKTLFLDGRVGVYTRSKEIPDDESEKNKPQAIEHVTLLVSQKFILNIWGEPKLSSTESDYAKQEIDWFA